MVWYINKNIEVYIPLFSMLNKFSHLIGRNGVMILAMFAKKRTMPVALGNGQ